MPLFPTDHPKDTEMNGLRVRFISHILMNWDISNISYYHHIAQQEF